VRTILLILLGYVFVQVDGIRHIDDFVSGRGTLAQIGPIWFVIGGAFIAEALWRRRSESIAPTVEQRAGSRADGEGVAGRRPRRLALPAPDQGIR
jgi:hypothetical protein